MKNAIQKAIEGGYEYGSKQRASQRISSKTAKMFLDPLFWQSLGKSLELEGSTYSWQKDGEEKWLTLWHSFIDHIASGGDVDEFFTTLIK